MCPFVLDRRAAESERCRRFFNGEPGEIAQPHDFSFSRVNVGQSIESAVERDKINVSVWRRDFDSVERRTRPAAAASIRAFGPRMIDQQPPHRLGGGAQEVGSPVPAPVIGGQPNPDLVHQGGWLKGVPGAASALLGHQSARRPTQLVIERVYQLIRQWLECIAHAGVGFLIGHAAIIEVFDEFPATSPLDFA